MWVWRGVCGFSLTLQKVVIQQLRRVTPHTALTNRTVMGYFGRSRGQKCGDTLCGQRTPPHICHVSRVREKGRVWRRAGVVLSKGYLRLSAWMVVLISVEVREKIVASGVWSLLT